MRCELCTAHVVQLWRDVKTGRLLCENCLEGVKSWRR